MLCGGIGVLTEYLADYAGQIKGIDFAPLAIDSARQRTRFKTERIQFSVENINALQLTAMSVAQVIAVDSLYFVHDLQKLVDELYKGLVPGGRFISFYSCKSETQAKTRGEETKLAQALKAAGFVFESIDFTINEQAIWERTECAAEKLKEDFRVERNLEIYKGRKSEARKNLGWQKKGLMSRHLYVATKP